jgi:hypothetical protein
MTCPSEDRVLDLIRSGSVDVELQAHVQTCADCRAYLRMAREIPRAVRSPLPVSERLIRRTMSSIPFEGRAGRIGVVRVLVTSVLGATTALATLVLTGEIASGGAWGLLGLSAIVAIVSGAVETRMGGAAPATAEPSRPVAG